MTLYSCNKCKMSFDNKKDHLRHLNRKTPCKIFICNHCNNTFTRSNCLLKHINLNRCKMNLNNNELLLKKLMN